MPITQGSALYIFFGQQTLKSPITSLCAQPQPNPSRAGSSTWSIPLAFVGTSGCSSWSWVGITACCKQTTPGSGNRESPGLALCRDSYNPAFARADNHSCSCTPQEGKLGLHQQLSQGKVGSAHTEHQSLWLSSGCLEHHRPARLEQERGRDLLSSPSAAALRLCPPSPGSETHSSHLRKPWTNILSRETQTEGERGHRRGQAAAALLHRLYHCLFTPHHPQEGTGLGENRDCAGTRQVMNGVLSVTKPSVSSAAPGAPARSHSAGGSLERSIPEPLPPAQATVANTNPCNKK